MRALTACRAVEQCALASIAGVHCELEVQVLIPSPNRLSAKAPIPGACIHVFCNTNSTSLGRISL